MGKETYVNKLTIGQSVTDCFLFKSISKGPSESNYHIVLSDKTGDIDGLIVGSIYKPEFNDLVGQAVIISGVVSNQGIQPLVKIRTMAKAESYKASDLMAGLSDDKIQQYTAYIRSVIESVKNPHYKQLLEACLNEENLHKLSLLPATTSKYARYAGGALASTASVTQMCHFIGYVYYSKSSNGIYTTDCRWSLLLTASLLHCIGNILYIDQEPPYKKTVIGMSMGLQSCLQRVIDTTIIKNNINISEAEYADLFGVLNAGIFAVRNGLSAQTKEGAILRNTIQLYNEMDLIDSGIADLDEGVNSIWNEKLHRVISAKTASEIEQAKEA